MPTLTNTNTITVLGREHGLCPEKRGDISIFTRPASCFGTYVPHDAATNVGIFASPDGGGSWTAASTGLTAFDVRALAVDPTVPTRLYAGTAGGGVFKSTDGGTTWAAAPPGLTNVNVFALAHDPSAPTLPAAGTYGGGVFVLRETVLLTLPLPVHGTVAASGLTCAAEGCTGRYPVGSTVTLTATPQAGYRVGAWTGCDSVSPDTTQCTLLMDAAKQVAATFTALPAAMQSPTPGSTLPGPSATFTWSAATNALQYALWVGTTAGGSNLYNQYIAVPTTTATVTTLPTTGSPVYVRLYTRFGSGWVYNDYTYTAAGP